MREDFTPKYKCFTNNKDVVVVVCRYAGRPIRGVAKCSPNDTFDLEKGTEIAKTRANLKVAKMRKKRALEKRREAESIAVKAWDDSREAHAYWMDARNQYKQLEKHLEEILREA